MNSYARRREAAAAYAAVLILLILLTPLIDPKLLPIVLSQGPNSASILPNRYWGSFIGTSGDVQVDIHRNGIAVRVEVPREFLNGVVVSENDTHFIQSDIRNDYYYYSVVDEAKHWTYERSGVASDGPCFKLGFSLYDANAPWCIEIWNYLNGTFLDFTPPRFVRFIGLNAPSLAGVYNFTVSVADHTNSLGLPDFVHAWNETLFVPVSMSDNPASIYGSICDDDDPSNTCPPILAKGIVYAKNAATGQVARSYVNQTNGHFNVTGLAPGDYQLLASAGIYHGVAFSLSRPLSFPDIRKGQSFATTIHLHRAPQVCGRIEYRNSITGNPISQSLSNHPYLPAIGFKVLNITIEATDTLGHVYRYVNDTLDSSGDNFRIVTGSGVKYVGGDPYGTEFAGLPPVDQGSYQLTVNVWITGYLQQSSEVVTVAVAPGSFPPPFLCNLVTPNPVLMQSAGVISGDIQFWNLVTPETPNQGEDAYGLGPSTGTFLGGNILIQAYDHTGRLSGVTVINGTLPSGVTRYADSTFVRFYVFGFSEFYNRTRAGTWAMRDNGLPADLQGYALIVNIRGYEQVSKSVVSLTLGGNSTVAIRMTRGGAIRVGVISYDTRPGTRIVQGQLPFRFLNLSIPVRIRVYFYDSAGRITGYIERLMVQTAAGVGRASFTGLFTGMNWSLREIWFYGFIPTHVTADTYSIRAYTLGYVQLAGVSNNANLATLTRSNVGLLYSNAIDIYGPIYSDQFQFGEVLEHDHSYSEVYSQRGPLSGAMIANVTAGTTDLYFPVFGFGAMLLNHTFTGQGHFFYVAPTGLRSFDYGLDNDTYTAQIPEFGFRRHFMQAAPMPSVSFNDLNYQTSVGTRIITMAKVYQGNPPDEVLGWVDGSSASEVIPLSWVRVEAINSSLDRYTLTLDGTYDGVEGLYLPEGSYNVTFGVEFYKSQTASVAVAWNDNYSLLPPLGPLCPTAGLTGTCDPPLTISSSPSEGQSGAIVFTGELNVQGFASDATYSWTASQGRLNSTIGQSVLWVPTNLTRSNTTISASVILKTKTGSAILSTRITLGTEQVPELGGTTIIPIVTFATLVIALRLQKRPITKIEREGNRMFTHLSPAVLEENE